LALADGSGTVQTAYAYEPFGNPTISGSSNTPYQYTGRENDADGLDYYRARFYSPSLGRFISEDPLGFAAGMNPYMYASGDPVSRTDAFGLTDIVITVQRTNVGEYSTAGTIHVDAGASGSVDTYSLEPPSFSPFGSSMPAGTYPATMRDDSGPGLNHQAVTLDPADGRTNIEIHPGNTPLDTAGCVLPGTSAGPGDRVNNSRVATGMINDLINSTIASDQATNQDTTITVIINDPPNASSTAGRKQ
jgi:RHS repeat-associated protein